MMISFDFFKTGKNPVTFQPGTFKYNMSRFETLDDWKEACRNEVFSWNEFWDVTVSYTHLTLPTILLV